MGPVCGPHALLVPLFWMMGMSHSLACHCGDSGEPNDLGWCARWAAVRWQPRACWLQP